ncbi:amino acid permease [Phenylobacterium sp.]|uniref:amino acid permease n=1 Tax=Phenylobacterium sp. TaxID=1871053 RepID=UPI0025F326D3|nr:amino acid permease [Phenylobacterium sp.]
MAEQMVASVSEAGARPADGHGSMGVVGAAALVAGSMVGSGVYLLPATLGAVGSISILGWIAATVAALAIAGVFAWLGRAAPHATGMPTYVEAGLGRFFGVQVTLSFWTSNWVGNASIALAVAGAAGYLVPALAGPGPRLAVTLAAIWFAVAAAWLGPRAVTRVEGLTLGLGLLPVILAATFGWLAFHPAVFLASWNPQGLSPGAAVGASALSAFWAFLGVECAAAVARVVRDPTRNVPRATLAGVAGVAVLYISACTVLMGVLPAATLAASGSPFAEAGKASLGVGLGGVIAVSALLRALGCVTGWTLVAAETTRSGADEGLFPRLFRTRPGERASPANLLTMGALMSLMAVSTATPTLAQQFSTLANIAVILSLYSYALCGLSLVRLVGGYAPHRRLAARATAVVAIGCAVAIAASAKPIELVLCLVPLGAAAALYLWLNRRRAL